MVADSNDADHLPTCLETVANRAVRQRPSLEVVLNLRKIRHVVPRSRGKQQTRRPPRRGSAADAEAVVEALDAFHARINELRALERRLLAQPGYQVTAADTVGKAGAVVDARDIPRPAVRGVGDQYPAVETSQICCRQQAGRSTADYDTVELLAIFRVIVHG